MLLRFEMQFGKLHRSLSLAAIALLLRGCYTQEFLKAVKRDPGIIGTNVALVCEYSPENIPFNYVQWTYSRLNDVNSRVKVYQYDRQGWAQSFEHLTSRSSHKHTHDTIQLDILNTKSDDDGTYYCTYGGISPKTAKITYTTISDATKCLQLDPRQERIVQPGNDVVITASSICCKPPIRFLWDGVDKTVYSPCAVKEEPFLESSTHFTRDNVQQDFEVTLTTKHPTGDMSVKYKVKADTDTGRWWQHWWLAAVVIGFVSLAVSIFCILTGLRDTDTGCSGLLEALVIRLVGLALSIMFFIKKCLGVCITRDHESTTPYTTGNNDRSESSGNDTGQHQDPSGKKHPPKLETE